MESDNIIFIAKYPTGKNQQDGASVRFLAIDNIFSKFYRTYIESFNFPLKTLIYTILKILKHKLLLKPSYSDELISSHKYINKKKTCELFEQAKIIYIESYGNLIMLPPEIIKKYGNKMIFDFHGCAIEEAEMANLDIWKINNLMYYEKLAMQYIKNFVVVSNNMEKYYIEKYPQAKNAEFITLPIFPNNNISLHNKETKNINIIYSGRNYVWQNSQLMVETISEIVKSNQLINLNYTFLTPDIYYYKNLAKKYNVEQYIEFKSVSPNKLNDEYAQAHLGFILRDDNIVNRVSCPTKLVEYMKAGIIPVVLQPEIGDFNNLGYKYILNSDLINGKIPSFEELENMRKTNSEIINNLYKQVDSSKEKLLSLLEEKNQDDV